MLSRRFACLLASWRKKKRENMLEEIENAVQELTIAYNIAQAFFEDDTDAKIGYFEQIVLGVIVDLQRVVDESRKPRSGRKQIS